MRVNWARVSPLAGVVAVVLWVIAVIVISGDSAGSDEPASVALDYLSDEMPIYAASWLWGLGGVFFLWFLSALRTRLMTAEGGTGRLTVIAYGAGIAAFAVSLGLFASLLGGAFIDDTVLSPEGAQALAFAGDGFFLLTSFPLLAMAAATAIVAFRHRALPRWLAWLTLLLAAILLAYPIVWIGLVFAFPIWVLITSVALWRSGAEPARAAPEA